MDTERHITLLNPAAEVLTGWTQAEASGKPIGDVFKVINEETLVPPMTWSAASLRQGKFDYLSPAIVQVTGYTPEEIYANHSLVAKSLLPDDRALCDALLSGAYDFEKPFTLRWRRRDHLKAYGAVLAGTFSAGWIVARTGGDEGDVIKTAPAAAENSLLPG